MELGNLDQGLVLGRLVLESNNEGDTKGFSFGCTISGLV